MSDQMDRAMEALLVEWHSPHRLALMRSLMHQLPPGHDLRALIHKAIMPRWRWGEDRKVREYITQHLKREGLKNEKRTTK